MSRKEFQTRMQMKNDTVGSWQKVSDPSQVTNVFIPLLGEPFLYREADGDGYKFSMKIGDGVRTPEELPNLDIMIDYSALAFNTNEIVVKIGTSPVLGQGILGQLVLA